MPNPLVSVIIPAYNAEDCIAAAIDSALTQTYRPLEVIVVNDGSTDKTAEIVKNYQQAKESPSHPVTRLPGSPVKKFKNNNRQTGEHDNLIYIYQENSGPSKARNTGVKAAKGEYIAFLDADDLWEEDKIKKQVVLLERDRRIDVVFTDVRITRLRRGKIEDFCISDRFGLNKNFFDNEFILIKPFEKFLKLNFMPTPSVLARKTCFKAPLLFNEKRRHAEDWELWLKMSLRFNFGYVNTIGVYVKDMEDGLSSYPTQMVLSRVSILEDFFSENMEYVLLQMPEKRISAYLKDTYKWAGYYLMKNGDKKLARSFYKKSLNQAFDVKTLIYCLKSFF